MTTKRFTQTEYEAIATALHASLASPVLDGFDDDSTEERAMRRAMKRALEKVEDRLQ